MKYFVRYEQFNLNSPNTVPEEELHTLKYFFGWDLFKQTFRDISMNIYIMTLLIFILSLTLTQ